MVDGGPGQGIIWLMVDNRAKVTRSGEIYSDLRSRLLAGKLEPGSKLKLGEFSAHYGVSLSVVREAVTRLAEQGLVQAHPQRGFWVMPLSVEDLLDLTRARVLIETLALRESIRVGGLSWESKVLAAHHTLQHTDVVSAEGYVNPDYTDAHRAFHHALLAGSGSDRLTTVAIGLRDCSELYQHWAHELAQDADRDPAAEHRTIAELSIAGDADGACDALAQHIERTTAALVRYAERGLSSVTDDSVVA